MSPRLGLVAFGTPTGLGYQTKALHDHLYPTKTLLIDLSVRKRLPLHLEWFPDALTTPGAPTVQDIDWLLDSIDVVFVAETPINYDLFSRARGVGVRTILQFNFEFLDYFDQPQLPKPTVFAAPSPWNIGRMDPARFPTVWHLPVPVDTASIRQRTITAVKTFLHVAGRPAARDRNGTIAYIDLARRCTDLGARWLVTCQSPTDDILRAIRGTPVELVGDQPDPGDLYADGDVMILPRRFGGLCMPALEAVSAGLPVLMPAVTPNTTWLPDAWLAPARHAGAFRAKTLIDLYDTDLQSLETVARGLWERPDIVTQWAACARQLAAARTWEALLPTYHDLIHRVMGLQP